MGNNTLEALLLKKASHDIRAGRKQEAQAALRQLLQAAPGSRAVRALLREAAAAFPGMVPKMAPPRLSVVVSTCNRAAILRDCLACLEAQDLSRELFEVLVVDDGSEDETPAFLQQADYPFVLRHFRQVARGGPARARNVGIGAARGAIILFINDDAMLEPGGLRTHLETHLALPEMRISVLGRFELPEAFRRFLWGFTLTRSDLVFDYGSLRQDTLYGGGFYYTCNVSTPKDALVAAGLFDEDFTGELWGAEDIEIGHRLASLSPPVGVLYREGCAAEHRHDLTVTDFIRMFRVRGGGAVRMFVRHPGLTVHYRAIRAADIIYWRNLPATVRESVAALHDLLRKTEGLEYPLDPLEDFPREGLKERGLPELYREGLSLWRRREDRLVPLIRERIGEVRGALRGGLSMQAAAKAIYPACLFLRWYHDTEGVCASTAIERICREPLAPSPAPKRPAKEAEARPDASAGETAPLFTVVTAAYNVAPWVPMFLASLAEQTLDFAKYIQVIIVDDGSTDDTLAVIRSWIKRYPDNITLISKENGGPASARNIGLNNARGEWVTFIDADDFVANSYFETVRNFLEKTGFDGLGVACKLVYFHEADNRVEDSHPLAYKFRETASVDLLEHPECIQLFINSCFVRRSHLVHSGLRLDERVKPSFEDGHFLGLLMLRENNFRLAFLKDAIYFYRKRGGAGGLVDAGWKSPAKYRDQILFGYLDLVQQYRRALGHVPEFVQNIVLYELNWYMVRMLDGTLPYAFSEEEARTFLELAALVFRHVDARHVMLSTLPAVSLRARIAMLATFKGEQATRTPFLIDEVAPGGGEAHLAHWSTEPSPRTVHGPHGPIPLPWAKTYAPCFMGQALCHEWRCWVPLREGAALRPVADDVPSGVFCGDSVLDELTPQAVRAAFHLPVEHLPDRQRQLFEQAKAPEPTRQFRDCWVLMDRVHKADDNAEHLYRWLMGQDGIRHPFYFVLDRKSKDWDRLQKEGFRLLPYHSQAHFFALAQAAWLVSSHVDQPVADPLMTRDLFGLPPYKLAFLQHGVIHTDLSTWLNQIRLDCLITSARAEYDAIVGGRYKFTSRETALTGLPRHDALLRKAAARKPGKTILVCPTWREHLRRTEAHIEGLGTEEARVFRASDYFRAWNAVTASEALARLAREHGYGFLFLPHPEVSRFLPLFNRSEAFTFLEWSQVSSVQDLLVECALAVTDYSSMAFELALIGRPVVYYQFPETPEIYTSHVCERGYFDHARDGFGPAVASLADLTTALAELLRQGCVRREPYESRAKAFFTLRDGNNCRRVYEAILERSS